MPTQPSSCLRSYADVAVSWRSPLFEHQASRQALALEKYPHTFRPAMISSLRRSRSVQRSFLGGRRKAPDRSSELAATNVKHADRLTSDPAIQSSHSSGPPCPSVVIKGPQGLSVNGAKRWRAGSAGNTATPPHPRLSSMMVHSRNRGEHAPGGCLGDLRV